MKQLSLVDYFTYHPPTTEKRKSLHIIVNNQAIEFAKVIDECVLDVECKRMAIFALQQCRMFANQGITVDELTEELT